MKLGIILGFFSSVFVSTVFAGTINGSLKQDGRPVIQGTVINIVCASGKDYPGATNNKRGSFRILVNETGKCMFILPGFAGVSHPVSSSRNPVRYDFNIMRSDNDFRLRRQ